MTTANNRQAMLNKARLFAHRLEDFSLLALLVALVFFSLVPIILRNTGINGWIWAGSLNNILVLWLAMFGAMRASRERNHIAIDLLNHYGGPLTKQIAHSLSCIFAAMISAIIAFFSFRFIAEEYEYSSMAILNIPTWFCEAIIPFSLSIISLRFFIQIFQKPISREHD